MITQVVIRGHSNLKQRLGILRKFFVFVFLQNCGVFLSHWSI